jgi:hypothetical protein
MAEARRKALMCSLVAMEKGSDRMAEIPGDTSGCRCAGAVLRSNPSVSRGAGGQGFLPHQQGTIPLRAQRRANSDASTAALQACTEMQMAGTMPGHFAIATACSRPAWLNPLNPW